MGLPPTWLGLTVRCHSSPNPSWPLCQSTSTWSPVSIGPWHASLSREASSASFSQFFHKGYHGRDDVCPWGPLSLPLYPRPFLLHQEVPGRVGDGDALSHKMVMPSLTPFQITLLPLLCSVCPFPFHRKLSLGVMSSQSLSCSSLRFGFCHSPLSH